MKRFYIFLLVSFVLGNSLYAQKLNALINFQPYCTVNMVPYVEFSFYVQGNSVTYKQKENKKFEAEVRITVDIKQNDLIIKKLDYILTSGELQDSNGTKNDFYDIKNIELPNGLYFLDFTLQDINSNGTKIQYSDYIKINYPIDSVTVSKIMLHKSFEKNPNSNSSLDKYGYKATPLLFNFIPGNLDNIFYTMEIYNTEKIIGMNKVFFVRTYLVNKETRSIEKNIESNTKIFNTSKLSLYINQLYIKYLPTGKYQLIAEIFSQDSVLIAISKTSFERDNPNMNISQANYDVYNTQGTFVDKITNENVLREYVSYLFPIASPSESFFMRENINLASVDQLKRFFYAFWAQRNSEFPEKEWNNYYAKILYVNSLYSSGNIKGYKTDRGRVYLQYGAPNSVVESAFDSHSYPYEIWHYNEANKQYNVQFIFYNPDLVSKDYELLHSDMIGEIQDPFWKVKLVNRKTPIFNFDDRSIEEYYGNSVEDDWKYMK